MRALSWCPWIPGKYTQVGFNLIFVQVCLSFFYAQLNNLVLVLPKEDIVEEETHPIVTSLAEHVPHIFRVTFKHLSNVGPLHIKQFDVHFVPGDGLQDQVLCSLNVQAEIIHLGLFESCQHGVNWEALDLYAKECP